MTTADRLTRLKTDFDDVYNAGYEQGKAEGDSYYDTFWDVHQQNGQRTNQVSAFSNSQGIGIWCPEIFLPKYDITANICDSMFYKWRGQIDLTEHMNKLGKNFKIVLTAESGATGADTTFRYAEFTRIPVCSFAMGKSCKLRYTFGNCTYLVTIDGIVVDKFVTYDNTFFYCNNLTNITIEGEIGNSISFAHSRLLTNESAKSVLTHLVNYTGTENEFAYKAIFHSDVWVRLDALGNDSPNGNTWREYVNDLGWNAS